MNTFDRHLLREWLQILAMVLIGLVGLLVVQVMYDDFRRVREMGAEGNDALMYFLVTIPKFLAFVLPVALLLSLLFSLGQMHRANEFTAMRAAGIGFLRLTRPVWIVGVLCCGLMWWLNSTVVPWSIEQSQTLEDMFQVSAQSNLDPDKRAAINAVGFDNRAANRLWLINRYSKFTGKAYGATVYILGPDRQERSRIEAREAERLPGGGWRFVDGREQTFDPESGRSVADKPFAERIVPEFNEDPELMLLIDRRPSHLSFFGLRRILDHYEGAPADAVPGATHPKAVPYAVRYYGLLADTLAPLIVIAIAIPFAVSGVRVNPAVGVSKSIGLFFLYYILANLGTSLATKQILDAQLAAWIPNVSLAALAIYLFARLR